jgi:glutamyl-tRNA synthetase
VRKLVTSDMRDALAEISAHLDRLEEWSPSAIHGLITSFASAKEMTLGKLAQPIRLAVSGGTVSPPLDATLAILGKNETLSRLDTALRRWAEMN